MSSETVPKGERWIENNNNNDKYNNKGPSIDPCGTPHDMMKFRKRNSLKLQYIYD